MKKIVLVAFSFVKNTKGALNMLSGANSMGPRAALAYFTVCSGAS